MFDIAKEMVELEDAAGHKNTYELVPLTGEYLEDLYFVMDKLQKVPKDKPEEILGILGTDAVKKLHNIVLATMILSYPAEDKKKLDQFVAQNLLKLIEPVFKINMPREE